MRGDFLTAYLASSKWAVCPSYASAVFEAINNGALEAKAEPFKGDVSSVMAYEKISNVAVITVRGAMDTRLTAMNAMCGGVANYEAINQMVDKAEADTSVDTILYVVDSNGGNVAGAEVTANKINSSKKRTVVLYENAGYSAAILVFAGVKERYASSKLTGLGSIGVITSFKKKNNKGEDEYELIRSSNAPNKVCDPNNKDCRSRIQASVDEAETEFISRVASYTGWSMQEVISNFDNGGTISAAKALQIGFISQIADYDKILESLITKNKEISQTMENVDRMLELAADNATLKAANQALEQKVSELEARIKHGQDMTALVASMGVPPSAMSAAIGFALNGQTDKDAILAMAKVAQTSGVTVQLGSGNSEEPSLKVDYRKIAEENGYASRV